MGDRGVGFWGVLGDIWVYVWVLGLENIHGIYEP